MSTIVLLSSSLPQTFARSPTPAESSSPLPSTASIIQDRSPGRKRFKAKVGQRDGFSTSFSTARQVLKEKVGAENVLIMSPRRTRFRSSQEETIEKPTSNSRPKITIRADPFATNPALKPAIAAQPTQPAEVKLLPAKDAPPVQSVEGEILEEHVQGTSSLERVTARKTDWTPPKPQTAKCDDERTIQYSAGYMNGMLSNFTYADPLTKGSATGHAEISNPAKRRKVELPKKIGMKSAMSAPHVLKTDSLPSKNTPARIRLPPKKALTITGVATSNYLGQDEVEESPIMQYLSSTQAQLQDTSADPGLETKIQRTKAAVKKLKGSKRSQPKSLLLSPQSAMKTYDSQDTIFGSASQLEREESPNFMREVIEATKQSESFLVSDPMSSPQRTQPVSLDNTPKAGTSRFRRTRNLWSAAGRDDDNALLHVDTVDLTDSPAMRAAFAGKDVMVQPGGKRLDPRTVPSLLGGFSPLVPTHSTMVVDIDSVSTPHAIATRTFTTSAKSTSPRKAPSRLQLETEQDTNKSVSEVRPNKQPAPSKPNYAGHTVHELNKLIKSYGFKAMRKRENMIELLDRCWEEKHGASTAEDFELSVAPFGDFLSKVHDISERPEPKTKQPRVRKKKDEVRKDLKDASAKKPRQRKSKELGNDLTEGVPEKPKAKRTRKSKASLVGESTIPDIDIIMETIPEELRALEAFEDWAKPERRPKPQTRTDAAVVEKVADTLRLPTPPPTLPHDDHLTSQDQCNEMNSIPEAPDIPTDLNPTPSATPILTSIEAQITAAIMTQSKALHPGRNHNINPTWHEKILLYDPIILEDLAAWLNTEGLVAVGEDKEVSALDVREWLEKRGICCLWRGGWRGNKVAQQ